MALERRVASKGVRLVGSVEDSADEHAAVQFLESSAASRQRVDRRVALHLNNSPFSDGP